MASLTVEEKVRAVLEDDGNVIVVAPDGSADLHRFADLVSLHGEVGPLPHAGGTLTREQYLRSDVLTADKVQEALDAAGGDMKRAAAALVPSGDGGAR